MNKKAKKKPKSLIIAYVSVFAALNTIANIIPFTPVLGVPEAQLRFGWIISTLTGILLGPKIGAISCFIGGLTEFFLNPTR